MPLKLKDLDTRPPEHGRIRYGVKTERAMKALTTFRFTSHDLDAIEHLAGMYGGKPRPWHEPMASPSSQFEVITESDRVSVWLPPNAYEVQNELWTKGGCERRCDGEECTLASKAKVACICEAEGKDLCRPYSRLNVVIPGVPFGGFWRLESKGMNFAFEAPGMIAAAQQMQETGMTRVDLVLTKRQKVINGRTSKYVVPQFVFSATPQQMLEGAALVSRMQIEAPRASALELTAASEPVWQTVTADDEIAEAEIVYDDDEPTVDGWGSPPGDVAVRRNPDPDGPKWIRAE